MRRVNGGGDAEILELAHRPAHLLSDEDLETLESWRPEVGRERRSERATARVKAMAAAAERKAVAEPQQAPAKTSGEYRPMPPMIKAGEDLHAWLKRYALRPTPLVVTDSLYQATCQAVAERDQRIAGLEKRIEDLEQRQKSEPAVTYGGTYKAGEGYASGQLVTKGGALWLAIENTSRVPGTEDSGWRLIVKSGGA
jgi:hypothetical protein